MILHRTRTPHWICRVRALGSAKLSVNTLTLSYRRNYEAELSWEYLPKLRIFGMNDMRQH